MKKKEPVYLVVVKELPKRENKSRKVNAGLTVEQIQSHGITEKVKRDVMKAIGPKKHFQTVTERTTDILSHVPSEHRETLHKIVQDYIEVFPNKLPKGRPKKRKVEHRIETIPDAEPPSQPPYRLGPAE